jgi:signal peptidase I
MIAKVAAGVLAVVAFVVLVVVLHPLFKRYKMPSESMAPTIANGDKINLDRGVKPAVGDIVVFNAPASYVLGACGVRRPSGQPCPRPVAQRGDTLLIKRIVAGPGDTVAFKDGRVIRNGKPLREPYVVKACTGQPCDLPIRATVPAGMYFMAGDNRGASDDSRFWGPVPSDWITGRVEHCHALYFACSPVR